MEKLYLIEYDYTHCDDEICSGFTYVWATSEDNAKIKFRDKRFLERENGNEHKNEDKISKIYIVSDAVRKTKKGFKKGLDEASLDE